jgi:hypothetical protein
VPRADVRRYGRPDVELVRCRGGTSHAQQDSKGGCLEGQPGRPRGHRPTPDVLSRPTRSGSARRSTDPRGRDPRRTYRIVPNRSTPGHSGHVCRVGVPHKTSSQSLGLRDGRVPGVLRRVTSPRVTRPRGSRLRRRSTTIQPGQRDPPAARPPLVSGAETKEVLRGQLEHPGPQPTRLCNGEQLEIAQCSDGPAVGVMPTEGPAPGGTSPGDRHQCL